MRPWKKLQRQTYDILSHKYSLLIVTVALTTILVSIIQFGETLVLWSRDKYDSVFSSFSDNVGRVSLQRQMCQEVPMDAVYTWVNGSDPELRRQLAEHRATLQLEASRRCPHAHCLPSVFAALHGSSALDEALLMGGELAGVVRNVTLARFPSPREAALAAASATTSISHAHWTSDAKAADTIARGALLLVGPRWGWGGTGADLEAALRWHFPEPGWTASLYPEHGVVALNWDWDQPKAAQVVAQKWKEVLLLGIKFSVQQAHLILALPSAEHPRDFSPSRFEDKDELRYSLRSLERHAPWIRRVFLVTNGQIPHWLDLDAARLTLVTHAQIFPHASHLPTFSSPAIESHLHRIPGLSTRFLYFNDDVFLGRQVWPEDFVTHAKGQKVYLSWGVPDCAAACPWAWVGDGSCDVACNSSACFFDNGDCSSSAWEHSRPRARSAALLAKVYQHNIGEEEPYQPEDTYPELDGDQAYKIKKHSHNDHNDSNLRLSNAEETKAPIELETIQTRSILQLDPNIPGIVRGSRGKVSNPKTTSNGNGSEPNFVEDDHLIRAVVVDRQPRGYLPRGSKHSSKHGLKSNESQHEQAAHLVAENQSQGAIAKESSIGRDKDSQSEHADKVKDGEERRKMEVLEWRMGLSRRQMDRDRRNSIRGQEWSVRGSHPLGQASQLDTFASSLLHVNRLLNQEFGFGSRRVPAHMPHLVDSIVMRALQDRFPNEWLVTSSHRVRSATDMQFAFSYFYFLMSERANLTIPQIFQSFDTDNSRSWSDREIRTLLTRLYELPLDHRRVLAFEHALVNCSEHMTLPQGASEAQPVPPPYERYQDSTLPVVTETLVAACPPIVELLLEKFGSSPKYKFEIVRAQDVSFKMLSSNLSQLVTHLDDIRRDPKKFICLNDNLDPSRESDNAVARAVLQDFYESLFPIPSSFELPTELRNRFLHVSELDEWKAHRARLRAAIFLCLLALVAFTAANFYQLECRSLQRKWFPKARTRVHPRTENV